VPVYAYIEYEGKRVKVEVPLQEVQRRVTQQKKELARKEREKNSLQTRIKETLRAHPEGLSKNAVYRYTRCYPSGGSLALAQLEMAGVVSFERVGNSIICKATEAKT
jgi:hypothetical protein